MKHSRKEEIKIDTENQRFQSMLAYFIDFVEQEAHRIDDERRGAHRKDGGRKACCATFLKQFLNTIEAEARADEAENCNKCCELAKKEVREEEAIRHQKEDMDAYKAGRNDEREEIIQWTVELSDKIEREQPDGGVQEWKAFKHFRNTLRDHLTDND